MFELKAIRNFVLKSQFAQLSRDGNEGWMHLVCRKSEQNLVFFSGEWKLKVVTQDPSTLRQLNMMTPSAVKGSDAYLKQKKEVGLVSSTSSKGRVLMRQNRNKHLLSKRKKLLPIMDVSDTEEQHA